MKNLTNCIWLFAAFVLLLTVNPAAAAPDQTKLGSVDLKRAVWESKPGKKARDDLKSEAEKAQKDLDSRQSKLESLTNAYKKQRESLNGSARQEREDEIQELQTELKRTFVDSQKTLQRKEQREEMELLRKLQPIVAEVGKAEEFSMILDKGSFPIVLYADNTIDVTDKVIKRFNELADK